MGYHFLLQRIFPAQGSNQHFLRLQHWQVASLPPVRPGEPKVSQRKLQKGNLPLELSHSPSYLLAVLPQGNGVFPKGSGFAHHGAHALLSSLLSKFVSRLLLLRTVEVTPGSAETISEASFHVRVYSPWKGRQTKVAVCFLFWSDYTWLVLRVTLEEGHWRMGTRPNEVRT